VVPLTKEAVRSAILHKVRAKTIDELVRFAALDPAPNLWGFDTGDRESIRNTVMLALYYYMSDVGLNELSKATQAWYRVGKNSLKHNVPLMLKVLPEWDDQIITPGSLEDWEESARTIRYQGENVRIHLRADSADFRIKGSPTSLKQISFIFPLHIFSRLHIRKIECVKE